MRATTLQRFGSLGKSFGAPSAAAAVTGAALLASDTSDTSETAWSPAAACLLPDVLPVAGTLLSYGGNRQLAAGGTVTHGGALNLGANALTVGAITASGAGAVINIVRSGMTSFGLGDKSGDSFRVYNNGSASDLLVIHGTTKDMTVGGNLTLNGSSRIINLAPDNTAYTYAGILGTSGSRLEMYSGGRLQGVLGYNSGYDGLVLGNGTYGPMLWMGGLTSSFPAIKRSGTTTAFRLADDSADGPISCGAITASGTVTISATTQLALTNSAGVQRATINDYGSSIRFQASSSGYPIHLEGNNHGIRVGNGTYTVDIKPVASNSVIGFYTGQGTTAASGALADIACGAITATAFSLPATGNMVVGAAGNERLIEFYNSAGNVFLGKYSNAGITVYRTNGNLGTIRASDGIFDSTGYVYWNTRGALTSSANGVVHVQNYDFNDSINQTLAFGAATTSTNGSRIKRVVGASLLAFRNGNDSADAPISCGAITASGVITASSAGLSCEVDPVNWRFRLSTTGTSRMDLDQYSLRLVDSASILWSNTGNNVNTTKLLGLCKNDTTNYLQINNGTEGTLNGLECGAITASGTVTATSNVATNSGQFIANASGQNMILLNSAGTVYGSIGNDAGDKWSLGYKATTATTLGTPVLTWTSAGFVGINKVSPTVALDVNGAITASGNIALGSKLLVSANSGGQNSGEISFGTSQNHAFGSTATGAGSVGFYWVDRQPDSATSVGGSYNALNLSTAGSKIFQWKAASVEKAYIDVAGGFSCGAITASGTVNVTNGILRLDSRLTGSGTLLSNSFDTITVQLNSSVVKFAFHNGKARLIANKDQGFGWCSASDMAAVSYAVDLGIDRLSSDVMEINNGTVGTLRDLKCRAIGINRTPSSTVPLAIQTNATSSDGVYLYNNSGTLVSDFGVTGGGHLRWRFRDSTSATKVTINTDGVAAAIDVVGAITASGDFTFSSTSTTQKISSSRTGSVGLKLEFPDNGLDFDDGISIGSTSGEHFKISSRGLTFGNLLQTYYRVDSLATSNLLWGMSDTQHIIYGGMIGGSTNPRITLNAVTHATRPNSVHFKTASGDGNFVWGFHQSFDETPVMLDIRTAAGARTDRVEWMDGGAWLTSAIDDAVDSQTAWVLRSASTLTQPNSRLLAVYNNTTDVFSVGVTGKVTASGAVQETPTQSALDPTTTDIPAGKRMGWYNSTLSEFRDWVNIGGTLLKSAAYT